MPSIVLNGGDVNQPSWSCPASQGRQAIKEQVNTTCKRMEKRSKTEQRVGMDTVFDWGKLGQVSLMR